VGDVVEVFPAYEEQAIRIELWGDEIERITRFDPLTGETITRRDKAAIYPATHFVTDRSRVERAVDLIGVELEERLLELGARASCWRRSGWSSGRISTWR
jgi:excinuclease ABC subunit B